MLRRVHGKPAQRHRLCFPLDSYFAKEATITAIEFFSFIVKSLFVCKLPGEKRLVFVHKIFSRVFAFNGLTEGSRLKN